MAFPPGFLDELRARLSLSEVVGRKVSLKRRSGAEYAGLCPFHNEKTPSFTVNDKKGFFYCFGCHEKGNRPELAEKEKAEIAVIERFLPKQMDDAAVAAAVAEAMASTGAKTVKDMGGVMAVLKAKYAGQMDFAKASAAVKKALAG